MALRLPVLCSQGKCGACALCSACARWAVQAGSEAHGRNVLVVASGDAVIALPGGQGTASEIALALKLQRCVAALEAWHDYVGVLHATSPAEAVTPAITAVSCVA